MILRLFLAALACLYWLLLLGGGVGRTRDYGLSNHQVQLMAVPVVMIAFTLVLALRPPRPQHAAVTLLGGSLAAVCATAWWLGIWGFSV